MKPHVNLAICDLCKKIILGTDNKMVIQKKFPIFKYIRRLKVMGRYHEKCFFKLFKGDLKREKR